MQSLKRCLLLITCLVGCTAWAENFEQGNHLFEQGKFAEAKSRYEQLVADGEWSANLFFNLGNAEFRLNSPGRAILNYERALAIDPGHVEAAANLTLARNQTGAKLRTKHWADYLIPGTNPAPFAILAAVGGWLVVFAGTFVFLLRTKQGAAWTLAGCAGAVLAIYGGLAVWRLSSERALGIVTAKDATARLAPAESAGIAGTLPAGSQVQVLSERGGWIYCVLPDSGRGWFSTQAVEPLKPRKS